jgi:TPR repeat protein
MIKGVATGDENLALLYEDGCGVAKDHARAVVLMRQAANAGDESAAAWLTAHHESPR